MGDRLNRPLIGVTGPDHRVSLGWMFTRLAVYLAGGVALRMTPSRPGSSRRLDGIVIGGGDDIDPELYSGLDDGTARIDRARDAFEKSVIDDALDIGLPILGICRGAQLMNVVMGGSLHQDLRAIRDRTSNRRTVLPRKRIRISRESRLHGALCMETCKVNSLHHQAVDRLGDGLRVVATDLDDIVQGIENPAAEFLLGVQWHPEYLPYRVSQRRLFRSLVKAAGRRSATS